MNDRQTGCIIVELFIAPSINGGVAVAKSVLGSQESSSCFLAVFFLPSCVDLTFFLVCFAFLGILIGLATSNTSRRQEHR